MGVKHLIRSSLQNRHARRWFAGRASAKDQALRSSLANAFETIARQVKCEHFPREMFVMVDYILTQAPPGPLVECGCYLGGSSAKLSLVARATGRKLHICDSFEGLPEVSKVESTYRTITGKHAGFGKGLYAARLDEVKANIERTGGDLSVCEFVPGYFCNSLPNLQIDPAFIFSDADLISSTRDVLKYLWPQLQTGGRFYTHDANLPNLILGILDPEFWVKEIGLYPPVMFGAGYGCGLWAGGIAYCEKSAESARRA